MTGSGTALDPYVIYTPADFDNIRLDPTAYYVLNNSIDCTGVPMNGFAPFVNSFRGSIDGQNFTVSNLVLTDGYFIDYTRFTAVIKNLNITNLTIPVGIQYAGFILNVDDNSEITSVHVNVNFNVTIPSGESGALAVEVTGDSIITNCSSSGSITVASRSDAGGLIGDAVENSIIQDSFSSVTVTSTAVGGLLHAVLGGFISYTDDDVQIIRCYATGAVTSLFAAGEDTLGGFIGYTVHDEQLINCYAIGNITGGNFVGGFVGFISGRSEYLRRCYSTGSITTNIPGAAIIGGFAGFISGITNERLYRCHCTGNIIVTSPANMNLIGGFTGGLWIPGSISRCYSTGDVTLISAGNNNRLGGFVGEAGGFGAAVTVRNCYERGDVTYAVAGLSYLAGFAGYTEGGVTFTNTYSTGLVTAGVGADVSGFVNLNGVFPFAAVVSSYWDVNTSGQPASDAGVGETTANMKIQGTFIGWSFVDVWMIDPAVNDGYPHLMDVSNVAASVSNITSYSALFSGAITMTYISVDAGFRLRGKLS